MTNDLPLLWWANRLVRFRFWWGFRLDWFVVFPDLVNDLQLGAILLIAAETDVIPILNDCLRLGAGDQHDRVGWQQILSLINRHPVVIDYRAGAPDLEVAGNFSRDLLESQHSIQLAIDPDTPARTDIRPRPGSDQL